MDENVNHKHYMVDNFNYKYNIVGSRSNEATAFLTVQKKKDHVKTVGIIFEENKAKASGINFDLAKFEKLASMNRNFKEQYTDINEAKAEMLRQYKKYYDDVKKEKE